MLVSLLLASQCWLLSACGGGSGGANPLPPEPSFLASLRYFPSPIGAQYSYHVSEIAEPLFNFFEDFTYTVQDNPSGTGVLYRETSGIGLHRGPAFSGVQFLGMLDDAGGAPSQLFVTGPGDTPDVLPGTINSVGQTWPVHARMGGPGAVFISKFDVAGTGNVVALQDLTIGSTVFADCLRVRYDFDYDYLNQPIPGLSATVFFAPDLGPILGTITAAGVPCGRVQLTAASIP